MATLKSRIADLEREFGVEQKVLWFTWEHDKKNPIFGVRFEDQNHMRQVGESESQFLARFEGMKVDYVKRRKSDPDHRSVIAGFYHFLTSQTAPA